MLKKIFNYINTPITKKQWCVLLVISLYESIIHILYSINIFFTILWIIWSLICLLVLLFKKEF
jgi:hypothetical protein